MHGMKLYSEDCATVTEPKGRTTAPALINSAELRNPPRDFTSGLFKRGSDIEDIYVTLRTGLDGTPMLSFAEAAAVPGRGWPVSFDCGAALGGRYCSWINSR
jgi:hypothetical protein